MREVPRGPCGCVFPEDLESSGATVAEGRNGLNTIRTERVKMGAVFRSSGPNGGRIGMEFDVAAW